MLCEWMDVPQSPCSGSSLYFSTRTRIKHELHASAVRKERINQKVYNQTIFGLSNNFLAELTFPHSFSILIMIYQVKDPIYVQKGPEGMYKILVDGKEA